MSFGSEEQPAKLTWNDRCGENKTIFPVFVVKIFILNKARFLVIHTSSWNVNLECWSLKSHVGQ